MRLLLWRIRPERQRDLAAIGDVTARAFAGVPYGDGTEADLVMHLRADGDLVCVDVTAAAAGPLPLPPLRATSCALPADSGER